MKVILWDRKIGADLRRWRRRAMVEPESENFGIGCLLLSKEEPSTMIAIS